LTSIVLHSGGTHGGHYIALVNKSNQWYMCNDSHVYSIETNEFQNYIQNWTVKLMIYSKINSNSQSNLREPVSNSLIESHNVNIDLNDNKFAPLLARIEHIESVISKTNIESIIERVANIESIIERVANIESIISKTNIESIIERVAKIELVIEKVTNIESIIAKNFEALNTEIKDIKDKANTDLKSSAPFLDDGDIKIINNSTILGNEGIETESKKEETLNQQEKLRIEISQSNIIHTKEDIKVVSNEEGEANIIEKNVKKYGKKKIISKLKKLLFPKKDDKNNRKMKKQKLQ